MSPSRSPGRFWKTVAGCAPIFIFTLLGLGAGGYAGEIGYLIHHGDGADWQKLGLIVRLVAICIGASAGAFLGALVGGVVAWVVSRRQARNAEQSWQETESA